MLIGLCDLFVVSELAVLPYKFTSWTIRVGGIFCYDSQRQCRLLPVSMFADMPIISIMVMVQLRRMSFS